MSGFDDGPTTGKQEQSGPDTGIVPIKRYNKKTGITTVKDYQTVALRIKLFRNDHPDWPVRTRILHRDDDVVVMICEIFHTSQSGLPVATGHSEEFRIASDINKTSALENAETSCIGRALACLGYLGSDFASAEELQNAIATQEAMATKTSDKTVQSDIIVEQSKAFIEKLTKAADHSFNALQKEWELGSNEEKKAAKNILPALKAKAQALEDALIKEHQDAEAGNRIECTDSEPGERGND